MEFTVDGIKVKNIDGNVSFKYKDVPVKITVIQSISKEDLIALVRAEVVDINNLLQDI